MENILRWRGFKLDERPRKKSKEGKLVEARALAKMLATMNSLPMPLISIVSGSAFGGGLG